MTVMQSMHPESHFNLKRTDPNYPDSPLALFFHDAHTDQSRELCNSFGAEMEDFLWAARCLATFHHKLLTGVDGEVLVPVPSAIYLRHVETGTISLNDSIEVGEMRVGPIASLDEAHEENGR